ncbi:unnamed protein product [Macrosiphum euphorbiae]|uniref:Uncharacterized protein n=1 Tax=Macrosiphum euphorbiae TaxID=13131 RepID=A0AAV0XJM2_9HEMI|nr:unnamed protein product [Macrosiphum euphorbiae]
MAIRKFETDCVLTNPHIELYDKTIECTSDSLYGAKKKTFTLFNAKFSENGTIVRRKKQKIETLATTSGTNSAINTTAVSYNSDTEDGESYDDDDDDDDYNGGDSEGDDDCDDYNSDDDDADELPILERNLLFEDLQLNYSNIVNDRHTEKIKRKRIKRKILAPSVVSLISKCSKKVLNNMHIIIICGLN